MSFQSLRFAQKNSFEKKFKTSNFEEINSPEKKFESHFYCKVKSNQMKNHTPQHQIAFCSICRVSSRN